MRFLKAALLIPLLTLTASHLVADSPAEEPVAPAEDLERSRDQDLEAVVLDTGETAEGFDACAAFEPWAISTEDSEPAPLASVDGRGSEAGASGPCSCSQGCCTGCPGLCCLRASVSGGACAAFKVCYRLDCPF